MPEGTRCCGEYGCRRANPYKLRYSELSKRWYLLTAYTVEGAAVVAKTGGKHHLSTEVQEAVIAHVLERFLGLVPKTHLDAIAAEFGLKPKEETVDA